MSETVAPSKRRPWKRPDRGESIFAIAVVAVYSMPALLAVLLIDRQPDLMMSVAQRVLAGHLDVPSLAGATDTVNIAGRFYLAVGPLQVMAYVPFAAVPAFRDAGGFAAGLLFGIPAALLSLPLARAYGARGKVAYWVAGFTAFGTLLFYVSPFGNFYYLAHAESFLALTLFLLEWAGRRRPIVLGLCFAFSFLARPTTIVAAIPFGIVLLWQRREAIGSVVRAGMAFGLPIAVAVLAYGWYNWVRFGSPLEAGYALSSLSPELNSRRALGVFSVLQIPENFRLALLAPFETSPEFPYLVANRYGMSMLLVSPALLTAIWAGFRERSAQLMWIAAGLVAIPVFLYYGGGYSQYGFRYSLDFTPFLIALVAIGSDRWRGRPERFLIVASIASLIFGVL